MRTWSACPSCGGPKTWPPCTRSSRGAAAGGSASSSRSRRGRPSRTCPRCCSRRSSRPPAGVMVARGDLGVELGFERMAEVQEEILWLAEAAHLPVIWATQVLETLTKTGTPTRGEVTDAAMSARAECVMLNKGPFVRRRRALRRQHHDAHARPQPQEDAHAAPAQDLRRPLARLVRGQRRRQVGRPGLAGSRAGAPPAAKRLTCPRPGARLPLGPPQPPEPRVSRFKLQAPYTPTGDQPQAIRGLVEGLLAGRKHQTLLGRDRQRQDLHHGQRHRPGRTGPPWSSATTRPWPPSSTASSRASSPRTPSSTSSATTTTTSPRPTSRPPTPTSRRTPRSTRRSTACASTPPAPALARGRGHRGHRLLHLRPGQAGGVTSGMVLTRGRGRGARPRDEILRAAGRHPVRAQRPRVRRAATSACAAT